MPPSQADPGLTAAWLLLRPAIEAASSEELKKNAKLRDQYNASRLKLGMTEREVESALNAKPIEMGEAAAGSWRLYGSTESLNITEYLHYSNVLALFRAGKLSGVYSGYTVPGGADGIRSLREPVVIGASVARQSFADLPTSKVPTE